MLSVTNVGLSAIADAEAGGFLINLAKFAVSETDVSAMSDVDKINAEGLLGTAVYEAAITSIEVVDTSAVRLTLTIPVHVPTDGVAKTLREIGVFLESGELFAYGALEPAYDKTNEYAVKIYVLVVANRLGDVINVVISNNNSLPSTPFVRSLMPPSKTYQNTILVLDQKTNEYQDAHSASIAVKTGPGSTQWSFLDHTRIYLGTVDSIDSSSTFFLNPDRGGFWLNDGEVVICQIVGGLGDGYSRKLTYDKETNAFTVVDMEWSRISSNSRVAIWRDIRNQLPTRTADMEDYLVLGVGINDWQQTNLTGNTTRYRIEFAGDTLSAGGVYVNPAIIGSLESASLIYVDGKLLQYGSYTIANDQLYVSGGANKQFDAFFFIPDTNTEGATLMQFESEFPTDGITTRYYLPIVPDTASYVIAFLDDQYIPHSEWVFDETSIVFNVPPSVGTLRVVCIANYDDTDTSTTISRFFYQAVEGGDVTFAVDGDTFDKTRIVVHSNGEYIPWANYELTSDSLTFTKPLNYVDGLAVIDIMVFGLVDNSQTSSVSGTDTGPVWTDPAGRLGPPNKLVPKVISYTSDGARTQYSVYNVPRKANVVMIAGGAFQDPRNLTYTKGSKQDIYGTIDLAEAMPFGVKIDFICFTDVADPGTATLCEVFNFTTSSALSYQINPVENDEAIMVFVGGAYQHKGSFTISNQTTLNLLEVEPGMLAEVWYFKYAPRAGWRTEMYVDYNTSGWINSYPMTHRVAREQNTLMFLDSVYQYKNKYAVLEANGMNQVVYDTPIESKYHGFNLINVYFVSGDPLTRLLLREDGENMYMPRNGPYVDWSNLSYRLRDMLACPMTKLLALLTGTMQMDFNNGTADDQDLANKYGLQPVTKTLTMSVLPTAAYAGIGSGATLGAKMSFNVFKYLEIYLKEQLGNTTFTIKNYEQGVKYFIDDIKLGDLQYEALARADIPMITYDTGIYINYPNALTGTTYPGVPLLTNFFDMIWSRDNVTLPAGWALTSYNTIKTTSVTYSDDDSTQTRTFTHIVNDGFSGASYTVKWSRPYTVPNHNAEYMTLVDGGGAPGYVKYFARLYAQWKYNDEDIVKCMLYNKTWQANGGISDIAWPSWLLSVRGGATGGNYPAVAGYTAGLTFGVVVDNYNASTGQADLLIQMTSGTIGYSYFPAEMLIKSVTIPVTYTMYPAISVNPDGSVKPMLSNEDLFKSCCWTDVTPQSVLDCGNGIASALPTVTRLNTSESKPIISGTYPYEAATSLSVTVEGQTFVNGVAAALTTQADTWQLNLAQTSVSLQPGYHEILVTVTLPTGATVVDASSNEVYVQPANDTTAPSAPTVVTKTYSTLVPVITGTYPSNDAAGGLFVLINGWAYSIGSNTAINGEGTVRTLSAAPLTVSGNNWSLDMSKDALNVLTWGTYSVTARVADAAGNVTADTTVNEVTLFNPVPVVVEYAQPGTYSTTVPAGYNRLRLIGIGGGAGGRGAEWDGQTTGSGSGAGGYVDTTITVAAGDVITVTVASKGIGGAIATLGTNGGDTTITVRGTTYYGRGGLVGSTYVGGIGGTGDTGQGGNGTGYVNGNIGGYGGSSYYTSLTGAATQGVPGRYGSSPGNHGGGGAGGGGSHDGGDRSAGSDGGDGYGKLTFTAA